MLDSPGEQMNLISAFIDLILPKSPISAEVSSGTKLRKYKPHRAVENIIQHEEEKESSIVSDI